MATNGGQRRSRANPRRAGIKVGHVQEIYTIQDDDGDADWAAEAEALEHYITLDVTVRGRSESVGVAVGVLPSEQGSARASGAMEAYGGGPTAWWVDGSDWESVAKDRDAVMDAILGCAGRLYREAQELAVAEAGRCP
jgi:hypothetical protein